MKTFVKRHLFLIIILLLILLHIFILLQLIFFPYPELFIYSYLTDKGFLPYKEIVDQHFPGLMFLPVNFHSLGIDTIPRMRLVHIVLTVITDFVFLKISGKMFKKRIYTIASFALFIFWQVYLEGHVLWIESFVTPLIMLSYFFLLRYSEKFDWHYLFASTFLLGISAVFKQTVTPLVFLLFIYLLLLKTGIKKTLLALVLFLTPLILVFIHFYKIGVLNDFLYWTITFNLTTFSQMGKTYPSIIDVIKLSPIFGVSMFSIAYLIVKHEMKYFVLLSVFYLGTLFFAYARFDYIHLQPVLPFAVLFIVLFLRNINKRLIFPILFVYCVISLYIFIPNFRFYNKPGLSPMLNDPETLALVSAVNKYRKNSTKIFASGTYPHIYYLTDTLPPGNIFSFQFPWFMKINEKRVLEGIIEDPPQLIIRDEESEVGGYKLRDYMQNVNEYIDINYKAVDSVNNIEILVKI